MKRSITAIALALASVTAAHARTTQDGRVFTDPDGFRARETPGGYEPAQSPLSGPVRPGTRIVFHPQPLTPAEAYPAPAPGRYPRCTARRTDACRQPR